MPKKVIQFYNRGWFWAGIFILILIIFGIMYLPKFNASNLIPNINDDGVNVADADDCSDYDLAEEYSKIFSLSEAEEACETNPAVWTATYSEVSCEALVPSTLDCFEFQQTNNGKVFKRYCEDILLADFVCIDNYYVGCVCEKSISKPSDFDYTENNCGDGIDNDNDGYIDCDDSDCDCDFCGDKESIPYQESIILDSQQEAMDYCNDKTLCYENDGNICYPYVFFDNVHCMCSDTPVCFLPYVPYYNGQCVCPLNHQQAPMDINTFQCLPILLP